jgi:hypothetical protein
MKILKVSGLPVMVFAIMLTSACTNVSNAPPPSEHAVGEFSEMFVGGYSADYEPATSTSELAEASHAVVSGLAATVGTGRDFGTSRDDPTLVRTIVLRLDSVKVLSGSAAVVHQGSVYIELPAPYGEPAATFAKTLPAGAPVVAYLELAPTVEQTPILNPTAGRPDGAVLTQLLNPQGLYMESSSSVVQVMTGEKIEGPIERARPDANTSIPEG